MIPNKSPSLPVFELFRPHNSHFDSKERYFATGS